MNVPTLVLLILVVIEIVAHCLIESQLNVAGFPKEKILVDRGAENQIQTDLRKKYFINKL